MESGGAGFRLDGCAMLGGERRHLPKAAAERLSDDVFPGDAAMSAEQALVRHCPHDHMGTSRIGVVMRPVAISVLGLAVGQVGYRR